ncbi:MAG: site-specific DNA-methyltransferase [Terriglobales bacterium]
MANEPLNLAAYLPDEVARLPQSQTTIPAVARDDRLMDTISRAARLVPTRHELLLGDARKLAQTADGTVHLVLTSPPYWSLKTYRDSEGQLGHVENYEEFVRETGRVWKRCFDALVPGGRLICVVGDVCLSRRENEGRHTVVPLHSSIQLCCRDLGFDNLAPILWRKIANAKYEAGGNSTFLGKPYEPNAVVKNDIEFILMLRKPGGYRSPDWPTKLLSVISAADHRQWFQQIWADIPGASTKDHPAPFPVELASRLVRMFSFVGDTVLDPFGGTGTTSVAAALAGRNSVMYEIDPEYYKLAWKRLHSETNSLFKSTTLIPSSLSDDTQNGPETTGGRSHQDVLEHAGNPGGKAGCR